MKYRLVFIILFAMVICFNVFASWTVYQNFDASGENYIDSYFLYYGDNVGHNIMIWLDKYTGELIVSFGSSAKHYNEAFSYDVYLAEEDGTILGSLPVSSPIFTGYDAITIYDILLRNKSTRIAIDYHYSNWSGFVDSTAVFEVSNTNLAEGIEQLLKHAKHTQAPKGVIKEFTSKDGGTFYLQATNLTSSLDYCQIGFSVLGCSSDKNFTATAITGDWNPYPTVKNTYSRIVFKCGTQEEVFSTNASSGVLIDNSGREKLDIILSKEMTKISIPDYSILVEVPTDELRNVLGLSSLDEKKVAEDALKEAEKAEAKAKRKAFETSTSFSLAVGLENTIGNSTANPKSPFSGGNVLISLRFTKLLFNSGFVGVSADGSFGNLGNSFGASADIGMGFSILQFGLRVPVRFSLSDSKIDKVIPQLFAEGFIPLRSGGLIVGFQFGLIPKDPGARAGIYIGYSFKSREGSFTTWNYKQW